MLIICRLVGHDVADQGIFNEGLYFSQCLRCENNLIRQKGGGWLILPRGLRIKWAKNGQHDVAPWVATNMARRRKAPWR